MNSMKDVTQKRMLNRPNQLNSPRLAKIGARSPNNSIPLSPTQKGGKPLFKNFQVLKHEQIILTQSIKSIQNEIKNKQPINLNIEKESLQFGNGDYYQGGINGNKLFGKGRYYFSKQKLQYNGQFYQNYMHGWGTLIKKHQNGQIIVYQGSFNYNKKHGDGKYLYDGQNNYYNGEWQNDQKHGKGVYFFFDGIYNGQWRHNKMEGQGTLKLNNGNQYRGTFENGTFSKGLIRYPNGDQYSGILLNGQRHAEGSYFSYKSQQRYKGQWMNDKKHGKGVTFLHNGDQFQATFNQGLIDQTQSCTYKWNSGPDIGNIFNGWFKEGKPEKGHIFKNNGQEFDIY